MEFVYIRRKKDGKILDIPKRDLEQTMKTGNFFLIAPEEPKVEVPVVIPEVAEEKNNCILCGFVAKSPFGLTVHKRSRHS